MDVIAQEVRARYDHAFTERPTNGKTLDAPGMGTFEVTGDKITAWRDYFYTGAHD